MSLDTDYALVMLTVVGNAGNDLLVMKPDKWPARIPKKHLYLIDPDDTDICIPASLADNNLIQRCDDAPITFAWAMRYLIEAVPLVPFKQPARPAMQIES